MRIHRIALVAGLLVAAQLAGSGCILIPKIVKRQIHLGVSHFVSAPLHATGATNTFTGAASINLRDSVDFAQVINDAGLDISKVDTIVVSKVEYRVIVADANSPARAITGGNLKVSVGAGALTDLITGFSHSAGATTGWLTAPLTSAGVGQLNLLLASILTELKGGATANEHVGYAISGISAPTTLPTDFWYEVRITLTVTGRVETDVLD